MSDAGIDSCLGPGFSTDASIRFVCTTLRGTRLPSGLFDPEDIPTQSDRERTRWFTDIRPNQPLHRSWSLSRGTYYVAEAHHFPLRFEHRRYSPDSRLPLPDTYARRYYASRGLSDSRLRSPYADRSNYMAHRDYNIVSPPARPRRSPAHSCPTPSAALVAPPEHPSPLEPTEPPLYMPPDLTREESSTDLTGHESNDSDSNREDAGPTPPFLN
ncbi:UNVERIFIED_CONTAM: hypothetical protein K2H54_057611 [Gekko kuhli]